MQCDIAYNTFLRFLKLKLACFNESTFIIYIHSLNIISNLNAISCD